MTWREYLLPPDLEECLEACMRAHAVEESEPLFRHASQVAKEMDLDLEELTQATLDTLDRVHQLERVLVLTFEAHARELPPREQHEALQAVAITSATCYIAYRECLIAISEATKEAAR